MRALRKAKTTVSRSEFAVCRGYGNGGNALRIGHARCVLRSDAPELQNLLFQEFSATLPLSVTRRNPFRPRFAVAGFVFSLRPRLPPQTRTKVSNVPANRRTQVLRGARAFRRRRPTSKPQSQIRVNRFSGHNTSFALPCHKVTSCYSIKQMIE